MTKKSQKNLQDPKNSSIFASEIAQDKSHVVFEVCSATPCKSWKPQEAMSIRDMLVRTERGQRLDVHTRFRAEGIPDNMYQAKFDAQGRMLPDDLEETFDHTPPDEVNDIVDVIRYNEELNERKEELKNKRQKREEAKPSPAAPPLEFKEKPQETKKDERGVPTSDDD